MTPEQNYERMVAFDQMVSDQAKQRASCLIAITSFLVLLTLVSCAMVVALRAPEAPEPPRDQIPPPIEVIATRLDAGRHLSDSEVEILSLYIEGNVEDWNAWCAANHPRHTVR